MGGSYNGRFWGQIIVRTCSRISIRSRSCATDQSQWCGNVLAMTKFDCDVRQDLSYVCRLSLHIQDTNHILGYLHILVTSE